MSTSSHNSGPGLVQIIVAIIGAAGLIIATWIGVQYGQSKAEREAAATATAHQTTSESGLSSSTGLTPNEVVSWCQGTNCKIERFGPLQESNGAINPNGVKMKTGDPVGFNVPKGISVDVWDCFKASRVDGPTQLSQVCEASFRRAS